MKYPTLPALLAGAARAVICLAFAASVQALAAQTVIVQDSFTLNGTTRVEGGNLAGASPEQQAGDASWKAYSRVRFSSGGAIVNAENGSTPVEARIAIAQPTAAITVSASVVNATTDWAAVGLLSSDTVDSSWLSGTTTSTLWVFIRPSGSWSLFQNGTSTTVASGSFSGYDSSVSYTLGLSYNPDTQQARPFLSDGTTETSLISTGDGWVSTGVAATSISAAGFRLHSNTSSVAGAYSLDNFLVTSVIPEPSSAALVMGGLALFGLTAVRRRHRLATPPAA